jgi:hypothetical protein
VTDSRPEEGLSGRRVGSSSTTASVPSQQKCSSRSSPEDDRAHASCLCAFGYLREQMPTTPAAPVQRATPPCNMGGPAPSLHSAETTTSLGSHDALSESTSKARKFVLRADAGPVGPCGPAGPTSPFSPGGPCGPGGPAAPVGPAGPAGPGAPAGPCSPGGPPSPFSPVIPCGPAGPCRPADPC